MRFLSTLLASVIGTLVGFAVLFLLAFLFFFAISLSSSPAPSVLPGSVLEVTIDGPIPERAADDPFAAAFGEGSSYDLIDLKGALRKAAADERIQAVWLRTRAAAPLQWATLEEIRHALMRFKESGKPLIASSEDFGMGEKAYFLASVADSVFAAPLAPFQLNGFSITQPFFAEALNKLNVEPKIVRAGQFKSAVEPFLRRNLSDANRLQLNALLETQNTHFKRAVAQARGVTPERLEQLADQNAVLGAEGALQAGLIDELRYYDEVSTLLRAKTNGTLTTVSVDGYKRVPAASVGLEPQSRGRIDVVYATGSIVSGDPSTNPFGNDQASAGSIPFREAMKEARTSDETKAVVLRINSPGGSAAASEAMWRAVRLTAAEKPVIVSMGDLAASGGYYIAAAADSIVANPLTITGSIGVFGLFFDASGLFEENLGVTFDGVQTSPLADIYSQVQPFTARERTLLEQSIDKTYNTFLQRVAAGRGMDTTRVHEIAQGRVWSGEDAKEVGLVDVLGGLHEAINIAAEKAGMGDGPHRVRLLPRPQTFIEQLNEQLYGQAAQLWQAWTASPLERLWMEQQRTLRRLAGMHGSTQARLPVSIGIN